jgi:hypothetical protein
MHAGKSTIAALLAKRWGVRRICMDQVRWDYYREIDRRERALHMASIESTARKVHGLHQRSHARTDGGGNREPSSARPVALMDRCAL